MAVNSSNKGYNAGFLAGSISWNHAFISDSANF